LSRIVSIGVVSKGPTIVANVQLRQAISSAHGQASISDWSSTMSAADRTATCVASRSSGAGLESSSPRRAGSAVHRAEHWV
jgi:hypothetical protein